MLKKITNFVAIIIIVFCTCGNHVLAAQGEFNIAKSNQFEQDAINSYTNELHQEQELLEEYKNLQIALPETFYQTDEPAYSNEVSIDNSFIRSTSLTTYAATSFTPNGVYKTGTATGKNLVYSMTTAKNSYYYIYKSTLSSEYKFGNYLSDSFTMPGMSTTNVMGSSCYDMVPQGIEIIGGYIFITAYCHAKEHYPVIYVLDSTTKKYITTLVIAMDKEYAHVGGIAYANYQLWVCGVPSNGKGVLHFYDFSEIKNAVEYARSNSTVKSIYLGNYSHGKVYLKNQTKASFLTAYKNSLCVGEFYDNKNGSICIYEPIIHDGYTLTAFNSNTIPPKAQGALFYDNGNNIYLIITTSRGIIEDSKVFVYSTPGTQLTGTMSYKKCIEMPKMIECAAMLNGRIYFVFESCSNYWSTSIKLLNTTGVGKLDIVGEVCGFNKSFIFK